MYAYVGMPSSKLGIFMRQPIWKTFLLCLLILSGPSAAADIDRIQLPAVKAERVRPLVAIVADNAGTETTDLVVPYGVLKSADVADIVIVSTQAGTINLMPALAIESDMTMETFDKVYPAGADVLIVPAMHDNRSDAIVNWVQEQAQKRAFVVAICEGAWIAARAGILQGRGATTHWYAFDGIARQFPKTRWIRDKRYVVDHNVMTTTGVTASIPASLALVEAMAGYARAKATATELGIEDWTSAHVSAPFHLTVGRAGLIARNYLAFWTHEILSIPITEGFDEIALALSADAWSRTYRSQAIAISGNNRVKSRHGLVLVPDKENNKGYVELLFDQKAASSKSLDTTLETIAARYGHETADLVALQLEYARRE
jgi:putative intracellular protease/amidase